MVRVAAVFGRIPQRLPQVFAFVVEEAINWENNFHRSATPLDEVCVVLAAALGQVPFLGDYIHLVDDKKVRITRGVPTLTSDAVPTILLKAPKCMSAKASSERAP